jgi:serpin B
MDEEAKSRVDRAIGDTAAASAAAGVVGAFGADLHRRLSRSADNLVCSPYSVVVALAMARVGARGRTAAELDRVLHANYPEQLSVGLGALETLLEKRSGPVRRADGSAAELTMRVANSLWGQRDLAWQSAFLDSLARHFGAGMRLVDYRADADGARSLINTWTSDRTGGRIERIVPDGAVDGTTRLVLVNAVHLKAPWEHPFQPGLTAARPFSRLDGSTVDVPTMAAEISGRYARRDGWQAVELCYAGNELAMTVIVPDHGTLPAFERSIDGARLAQMIRSQTPAGSLHVWLPKWTFRTSVPLADSLAELGMPTAFEPAADFSGMTTQEKLSISAVLHEAFITVDETGTEAAAATAVVARQISARPEPLTVDVNRPFLFVIHDRATGTPLFIGRVTDPTGQAKA